MSKQDIKIDVDDTVMSISVDQKHEQSEQKTTDGVQWHHSERARSFVKRSLRMPETADMENITAEYADGVLHVSVPKREVPVKVKRVEIA